VLPPIVAFHEIVAILGVSRARVTQLMATETFPDHYVQLQVGRIWLTEDIVQWAQSAGRTVNFTIPNPLSRRASSTAGKGASTASHLHAVKGGPPTSSTGRAVKILPEEKNTEVAEKHSDPSFASLTTDPRRDAPPDPEADPQPRAKSPAVLNQEAMAEDWDRLEKLYALVKRGGGDQLTESEILLVPFAAMVFATGANVPAYRRTKTAMLKAWGEVRKTYTATPEELLALGAHVASEAQKPWTPNAVKKFSDYEIATIRRMAVRANDGGRTKSNRWQGGRHGQHEAGIATLTDEEKRRYGVEG
jgi:predicted DNA-binding transcriptional regulator AlpA